MRLSPLLQAATSGQHCSMFLPFKHLSTRQSAGYAVLCVVLAAGIKYLDNRMPEQDVTQSKSDALAWSDLDEQNARKK